MPYETCHNQNLLKLSRLLVWSFSQNTFNFRSSIPVDKSEVTLDYDVTSYESKLGDPKPEEPTIQATRPHVEPEKIKPVENIQVRRTTNILVAPLVQVSTFNFVRSFLSYILFIGGLSLLFDLLVVVNKLWIETLRLCYSVSFFD